MTDKQFDKLIKLLQDIRFGINVGTGILWGTLIFIATKL